MRIRGSSELLEARRWRAMKCLDDGLSLNEAARLVGCYASSVMRWRDARRRRGAEGLKVRIASGRPPRLTKRQRRSLVCILKRGAMANGYRTELWTTARIAEVIQRHFKVRYHRDHIGRLMASLNWSYQKPERRALQRDDEAIEEWKRTEWSRIKKTLRGWTPTSSS